MQPTSVVHETRDGLHRLTVNGKPSRWEPELLPCKVKITLDGKEITYFASADLESGLPEIFLAVPVYGTTLVEPENAKNIQYKLLDEL